MGDRRGGWLIWRVGRGGGGGSWERGGGGGAREGAGGFRGKRGKGREAGGIGFEVAVEKGRGGRI